MLPKCLVLLLLLLLLLYEKIRERSRLGNQVASPWQWRAVPQLEVGLWSIWVSFSFSEWYSVIWRERKEIFISSVFSSHFSQMLIISNFPDISKGTFEKSMWGVFSFLRFSHSSRRSSVADLQFPQTPGTVGWKVRASRHWVSPGKRRPGLVTMISEDSTGRDVPFCACSLGKSRTPCRLCELWNCAYEFQKAYEFSKGYLARRGCQHTREETTTARLGSRELCRANSPPQREGMGVPQTLGPQKVLSRQREGLSLWGTSWGREKFMMRAACPKEEAHVLTYKSRRKLAGHTGCVASLGWMRHSKVKTHLTLGGEQTLPGPFQFLPDKRGGAPLLPGLACGGSHQG